MMSKRMEKTGFKKTEVGLIPSDWNLPKLSEISIFENGKAHEQFIDDKGDYIVVNSKFISTEGDVVKFSNRNLSPLQKGNIAIVMSDIPNGKALAKCFPIDKDNRYTLNQRIGCIKPNEEIDNEYLFYKLNRNKYFLSFDSGSGQTNLKKSEILDCPVPLPPTKAEQTAIAAALNDADALITQLEKLITKKRNIKQGAMQELLKPKKGWEVKKLGEVCSTSKARFDPVTSPDNYKCIELEHLSQETGRLLGYVDSKGQLSQKAYFKKGDVLFGKLRPYLKKFLHADFEGVCSTEIWVLKAENGIVSKWLYYLIQSNTVLEAANQSTGTKMPRAEWSTVGNVYVFVPLKAEQNRIATILSDMDAEIEAMEKKLEKYRQIKQGMMQELLTGRIRLV